MNLPTWCTMCRYLPRDALFFIEIYPWGVAYRESCVA